MVFRLKRPQPSLLTMLASGYSPVLPAHVPLAEHRAKCIGTGPFKFKEWKRGEGVELVKNPDYFVKGRPYLDGIHYIIIVERGTRVAALQAGQVDVAYPGDTTVDIAERLKGAVPKMVFTETSTNVSENLLFNTTKAPLDNVKVRRALSLAIDRKAYVQAVHRGSAIVGAAMSPKPWGVWGLLDKDLAQLAGYGKGAEDKARAKKLLAEAGFGPSNPLKMEMVTRAIAIYIDFAAFVVSEFKNIGVEATLKQIDTAQWHPMATRREFLIGANLTGPRHRRSRRQLLRELRLRLAAQLRRVLQRAGHGPDRQAVAGDRSAEAHGARRGHPEEARGGLGPPDHGLAHRSLRAPADGEEPRPPQRGLQLLPSSRHLARQVAAKGEMARAYRLGVARRIVNGIIRTLLRMGWGPARTYLLVTRGRTTGRLYHTPVTLVEQRTAPLAGLALR